MRDPNAALVFGGLSPKNAAQAMVMVHGRGGSAHDILGLSTYLERKDLALLAPHAKGNSWYPYSFLAPRNNNEPGLSAGLELLQEACLYLNEQGIADDHIFFLGFSQGACLTCDFLASRAHRYAGAFLLSGGLIGDHIAEERYKGDFAGTPVFFGVTDRDPHVPLDRVEESASRYRQMGAAVKLEVYPGRPHSIYPEEIAEINAMLGTAG